MKIIPIRQIKASDEVNFSEVFKIRDLQSLLNGKDMIQELHRHDYFFVLVLKKGKGSHEIDFNSYKVCDNSIFFLRPGQVHQLTLKAGSSGYLMQFKTDFYYQNESSSRELLRKAGNKNFCRLSMQKVKKLLSVLDDIFQEYSDKQEGYKEVIKANLGIFFIELIRGQRNKKDFKDSNTMYSQERIEKLSELLEANVNKIKQVSQYAEMMNLSVYQLNAITKEVLGKTCSELINEHIILESKRYLLATSNQVNQIAYSLGYEDISYFIRFFRKHTGYSPNLFRETFK
jgi:AraC-like DNA-binding protein